MCALNKQCLAEYFICVPYTSAEYMMGFPSIITVNKAFFFLVLFYYVLVKI